MSEAVIIPLSSVDARHEPADWAFAREEHARIAAHWQKAIADKPSSFDGRVLLQHRWSLENGVYRAGYLEANYSAFLAWRDFGAPGTPMRNGFAMAALRAADGAFLLGEMGAHTSNAGKVYFAAGTPDLDDVTPDGRVDLAGSVLRELSEETGLRADEVRVSEAWHLVLMPPRAAFMRPVTIDLPAEEARTLMLSRMAALEEQELADIVIVRSEADLDPARMPPFQIAYLRAMFSQG